MKVIAHDCVRQYGAGKNFRQLGNLALDPRFAVFKGFLQIAIPTAEPRSAHAAGKAIILNLSSGSGVYRFDTISPQAWVIPQFRLAVAVWLPVFVV